MLHHQTAVTLITMIAPKEQTHLQLVTARSSHEHHACNVRQCLLQVRLLVLMGCATHTHVHSAEGDVDQPSSFMAAS